MTDTALLDARKSQARDWFETLRDRICSAFEALEQAAPADLYPGQPASFVRTPWQRPAGGGGVRTGVRPRLGMVSCLVPREAISVGHAMVDATVLKVAE